MQLKNSYDYLKDSIMTEEEINYMVGLNPYKRFPAFMGIIKMPWEGTEHTAFNQTYQIGYVKGKLDGLMAMAKKLNEKGMEKEEIRIMINQILNSEVLTKK